MATFSVTYSIPDINLANALAKLQRTEVKLQGETNLQYIKRLAKIDMSNRLIEGARLLAADIKNFTDEGLDVS